MEVGVSREQSTMKSMQFVAAKAGADGHKCCVQCGSEQRSNAIVGSGSKTWWAAAALRARGSSASELYGRQTIEVHELQ
jgi:hypothetical protein